MSVIDKINKAHQIVCDLCQGKVRWTMTVPAKPESDTDLIIDDALSSAKKPSSNTIRL